MRMVLPAAAALVVLASGPAAAAGPAGERVRVTGELIDTWCYFSGVMGGPEAVTGSAHHTCAMWCAAGASRSACSPMTAPCRW